MYLCEVSLLYELDKTFAGMCPMSDIRSIGMPGSYIHGILLSEVFQRKICTGPLVIIFIMTAGPVHFVCSDNTQKNDT